MKKLKLVLRNNNYNYLPFVTYNPQKNDILLEKSDDYVYYNNLKIAALRKEVFNVIRDVKLLMSYNKKELTTIFNMLQKPGGKEAVKYYSKIDKEPTSIFNLYDIELNMINTFVDYEYESLFTKVNKKDVEEICKRLNSKSIHISTNTISELLLKLENVGLYASSIYYSSYNEKGYTVIDMLVHMLEHLGLENFKKLINEAKVTDINELFYTKQTISDKLISSIMFYMEYGKIDIKLATFVREYYLEPELAKKVIEALIKYPLKTKKDIYKIIQINSIRQLNYGIELYKNLKEISDDLEFSIIDLAMLPTGREYIGRALSLYRQFYTVLNTTEFYVFKELVKRPMYLVKITTIEAIKEINDLFDYIDLGFTEEEIITYSRTTEFSNDLKPLLFTIKFFRDLGDDTFEKQYQQAFDIKL
jgi:hypothetical protein